ncbi:MAG: hypothetical protein IPJ77_22940 [Planctomycetes bacterium]|nr:hypothetical protein [Planctomycetota bacterium]
MLFAFALATLSLLSAACTGTNQPIELGRVSFSRSIDEGLARAGRESKPAFVLFQEVPG